MKQVRKLPVFHGFTVHRQLREFRKVLPCRCIQLVPFNTPHGRELLEAYERR